MSQSPQGMTAVIAEPPAECQLSHYIPQVDMRIGRVIVLLHSGAYAPDVNPEAMKALFINVEFSVELLQARKMYFLGHLQDALDSSASVSGAVELALERMNEILRRIVGPKHEKEGFWRAQNNTMVVIIQQEHAHVFGHSGVAFLCRGSDDKNLARPHLFDVKNMLNRNLCTKFCYYHKEKLTIDDSYLVVGTVATTRPCVGSFSRILLSRVEVFGLEEACKQIAGRFSGYPRTFVCVPLNCLDSFKGESLEHEPASDWGVIGPHEEEDKEGDDEFEEEDEEEDNNYYNDEDYEIEHYHDDDEISPSTHLYPLEDGKPQFPAPVLNKKMMSRDPCIRTFNFENAEAPAMICKYNSCVIEICRASSKEELYSSLSPPPNIRRFTLLTTYKNFLCEELAAGRTRVAFYFRPFYKHGQSSGDLETSYKYAEEIIRFLIERAGSFNHGKEGSVPRIHVYFLMSSVAVWRAFVGATDLLADWSWIGKERWETMKWQLNAHVADGKTVEEGMKIVKDGVIEEEAIKEVDQMVEEAVKIVEEAQEIAKMVDEGEEVQVIVKEAQEALRMLKEVALTKEQIATVWKKIEDVSTKLETISQ